MDDEYSESHPRYPAEVCSGPFTFSGDGRFKAGGLERAPLKDLQLLFRKNASSARRRQATRDWIIAQLRLYGIPFSASSKKDALLSVLEKAVRASKCNKPTQEVAAVEQNLRCQWDAKMDEYKQQLDRKRIDAFEKASGDPTAEVSIDANRFLAKHFLDNVQGKPDRSKTRGPLLLHGYFFSQDRNLEKAVNRIPGLVLRCSHDRALVGWDTEMDGAIDEEFFRLGSSGDERLRATRQANFDLGRFLKHYFYVSIDGVSSKTSDKPLGAVRLSLLDKDSMLDDFASRTRGFCIKSAKNEHGQSQKVLGWDVEKVDAEIGRIGEECRRAEERQRAKEKQAAEERNAYKQEHLKPHEQYKSKHRPLSGIPNLQTLPGSYVLQCDKIHHDWPGIDPMTIDIFPADSAYGLKASVNLNVFEGTMLLAMSEQSLVQLRTEQPKSDRSESEEEDDNKFGHGASTGEKRQIGSVADPWGVREAMAKRQKASKQPPIMPPNRVHLQLACRQSTEFEIEYDTGNRNVGYLDFDSSNASAHGILRISSFWGDKPLAFSVYKISDEPDKERKPEPWHTFQ